MVTDELQNKKQLTLADLFSGLKLGKFILHLYADSSCVRLSADLCKIPFKEEEVLEANNRKRIELYINGVLVGSGCVGNFKTSKREAYNNALKFVQEHSYTIKVCLLKYIQRN